MRLSSVSEAALDATRALLIAVAAWLAAAGVATAQTPGATDRAQDVPETPVADILVEGQRLEERIERFVSEAAAPSRGRGLARWRNRICVGVVNVRADAAQFIADRVSQVALGLGLTPGYPGCRADVIIVFTNDGPGMAALLAEEHRRAFMVGTGGLDRGRVAFNAFVRSDRAVRWWHTSMPVNAETGQRAIRLPGDVNAQGQPTAPSIAVFAASRLTSQLRDDLRKAFVIVDIDRIGDVTLEQLADFLAFVSLSQVDLEGDFSGYDSILTLFDAPNGPAGLTDWDQAYLTSLYRALDHPQFRRAPAGTTAAGSIREITGAMTRDQRRAE